MIKLHPTAQTLTPEDWVLLWRLEGNTWIYAKVMSPVQGLKSLKGVEGDLLACPYWLNPNNDAENALPYQAVGVIQLTNGKLVQHGEQLFHLPDTLTIGNPSCTPLLSSINS